MIDIVRFTLGAIILSIGAYTDLKTRQASNKLWLILGIGAFILMITDFLINGVNILKIIVAIILIVFFYLMFEFDILKGGADIKAIMCLSILIPFNVFDVFILSSIVMFLSMPLLYFYKKWSMKKLLFEYPYPFLVSLLFGFIISFFLSDSWNDILLI